MIRFAKEEARMLVEDETRAPTGDIDFRVRCVVHNGNFERLYYGITASDYTTSDSTGPMLIRRGLLRDVTDTFDHSEGRGKKPTFGWVEPSRPQQFFTSNLGRHDEVRLKRATTGSIRK